MRWLLILLWCVSSFAWAAPTKEQQEKAVALYEEAETYYRLLNYNKALALYQEAYVLSRETSLLFNIGQCYRLLGRYQEAKATYELYLRDAPTSEYRAACERFLQEVNDAIANGPAVPPPTSQPPPPALTPIPKATSEQQPPPVKMFLIPAGFGVVSLGLGGAALLVNRNLKQELDPAQTTALRERRLALSLSSDAALLLGLGTLTAFTIEHLRWKLSTKEAQ